MTEYSIVRAGRGTHLKIAFVAVVASFVFVALMSASSTTSTSTTNAVASGPAIKATTTKSLATSDDRMVR